MRDKNPPNATDISKLIVERLAAMDGITGAQETVTIEWRGNPRHIPVITMPVDLLYYNPGTHRIRAQRSTNLALERQVDTDPYGAAAQNYLHQLLMGDPAEPTKVDPNFIALKEDLREHGQSDPGIITRAGVLVNGNTRRAALKDLGEKNIRVGILPLDAGHDDIQSIELSLQLRKDHKRDYSFMNFLLAIDERAADGQLPAQIQTDFRIKATTYERSRWILDFIRDAIERSRVSRANDAPISLSLVDFEAHQGKLEELYRAHSALAVKSPNEAAALREQRLLGIVLDKSKTDLRLIEQNFVHTYMKDILPTVPPSIGAKIPGTSITVPGPSQEVQALRELTTRALQARSVARSEESAIPEEVAKAASFIGQLGDSIEKALNYAGKQSRVVRRRFAPADRLSDACDNLQLAVQAIAEARSTSNFDTEDLDEVLVTLKSNLEKLAAIVVRDSNGETEGIAWLRALGQLTSQRG